MRLGPDVDRVILTTDVIFLTTILLVSNSFSLFAEPPPKPHHGVIRTIARRRQAEPGPLDPGRRAITRGALSQEDS